MCHYVSLCVFMCHYVSLCVVMCHYVSLCVIMCHYVSLCVVMCHYVHFRYSQNKKKTEYIKTIGNCCWQISNKQGVSEDFGPGEARETKEVKYITVIKTIDCPTY